jgi:hypothetical protein
MTETNDSAPSVDSVSKDVEPKQFLTSTSANLAEERPPLPILQERTRSHLAKLLVYSFIVTVIAIFINIGIDKIFYYTAPDKANFKEQTGGKDLINLVLTTQSTLVAAAIGFYFGTRDNK